MVRLIMTIPATPWNVGKDNGLKLLLTVQSKWEFHVKEAFTYLLLKVIVALFIRPSSGPITYGNTSFTIPSPNSLLESLGSSEGRLSTAIIANVSSVF